MAAGFAKDAGRGWSDGNTWSEPVTLRQAVERAPVFIRLEEGDRGDCEQLSFSAGDTMALEGEKVTRGRRLVLAHYTTELDNDDIYGESGLRVSSGLYCALLTLPYDCLPDIEVSIMEDPDGHFYSNFLATNFPDCNWKEQQDELLDSLDEHDYTNVSVITPKPKQRHRETWRLSKPPPPPPPKPPLRPPGESSNPGSPCPARPPKPKHLTGASSGAPPPRPPRQLSHSDAEPGIHEVDQDEMDRFSMPTIGDVFGSSVTMGNFGPPLPLPEKDTGKEKQKEKFKDKVKSKMKNLYVSVSKPKSPQGSPKLPRKKTSAGDDEYIEPISDVFGSKDKDQDDSDSDSDANYDMIEEKQMDPKYDPSPQKKQQEKAKSPPKKEKKEKKGDKQKKGEAQVGLRAKPTVRVTPQVCGDAPLTPGGSLSDRPPMAHSMMCPASPGEDLYDLEPKTVTSPLEEMTCDELCTRLQKCGLLGLAKSCKENVVDGAFFVNLNDDILRKPPFSLNDFELNTKLTMVKAGWVPK